MFIDASALTAMLTNEEDAQALLQRLQSAGVRVTSPMAVWETVVAVTRRLNMEVPEARQTVDTFLTALSVSIMPITPDCGDLAVAAYDRFGKSRHPAGLNFGDCFVYACARHAGLPLLYKGDDFALTDIDAA